MNGSLAPGLYGKMPCLGDFISRGLTDEFISPWDDWLQRGLYASQQALGETWQEIYLTSPLWRFAVPAGRFGPWAWAGVLMPSVDRVGRCFPLTLAAPLPEGTNPFQVIRDHGSWFGRGEDLLLSALDCRPEDLERFWDTLTELSLPQPSSAAPQEAPGTFSSQATWVPLPSVDAVADAFLPLLGTLAGAAAVWWTSGSQRVPPGLLSVRDGPSPDTFTALLDGQWQAISAPAE